MDPAYLPKVAFSKYQTPPKNRLDSRGVPQGGVRGNAKRLRFYAALAKKVQDKDPVTWLLDSAILKAEVKDEEKYERYLGKM